ncbi:hypothetical protein GCM10023237_29560 [Streptomyces coeruleoprunus]|uniref:nuclear transport factor 2 family protein n=1 Tax=Streptomyces coeruleoprunus TaxID=285563 RepID=UPI0031ED18FD
MAAVTAGLLAAGALAAVAGAGLVRNDADHSVTPLATAPPTVTAAPPAGPPSRGPLVAAAQRYLDAVAARDAGAVASAFAPDGLVVDVGREIRGRDAIRRWAAAEVIGGSYTLLDHTPHPGGTTLLVRFRPDGTGDGFRARYRLDITDGLITTATLEYA